MDYSTLNEGDILDDDQPKVVTYVNPISGVVDILYFPDFVIKIKDIIEIANSIVPKGVQYNILYKKKYGTGRSPTVV